MATINIEKSHLYLLAAAFIFLVGVGLVISGNPAPGSIPNPGHSSAGVAVNIKGADKTLQQAIDAGDFTISPFIQIISGSYPNTAPSIDEQIAWAVSCGEEYWAVSCNAWANEPGGTNVDTVGCDINNQNRAYGVCSYLWNKKGGNWANGVYYDCTCAKKTVVE